MKVFIRPRPGLIALFGPLIGIILFTPLPATAAPQVREFTINATQFQFAPGRLEVNAGDKVIIALMASDVVHGFYLDGYEVEQRVTPGVRQRIKFVADKVGKFRYRCLVSCGPLHPFMIGELVVGPNFPYWRAAGVMLVALIGMFIHFRLRVRASGPLAVDGAS